MKSLVVYSSKTGNTKKMAETVQKALPEGTLISPIDEAPDPFDFDYVAVGFWLQGGKPDPKASGFLQQLKNHKRVFLFASHGADPSSDHCRNAMAQAGAMADGAVVCGTFNCYGEVNPNALEKIRAKPEPPPWAADADNAVGHPDDADLERLGRAAAEAVK